MSQDATSPEEIPEQLRSALETSKKVFGATVLEDELLFAAVQKSLGDATDIDMRLPDFTLEPWRPISDVEGEQILGLRISQGTQGAAGEAVLSVGMKQYSYIPVFRILMSGDDEGAAHLSDEIKELSADREVRLAAFEHYWASYKSFMSTIADDKGRFKPGYVVDPSMGTFELDDDGRNHMAMLNPKD